MNLRFIWALLLALLVMTGCRSDPSRLALDRPLLGRSAPSSFLVDTDRPVSVRELARWAKVIGPYKQLTPREIARIETRLRQVIDDLTEVELHRMEGERPPPGKLGGPRPRLADLRAVARERVLARLGKDLALPLLTSDNRSAVAFARISGESLEVTSTAYEIDKPPTQLQAEAHVTALDGRKAKVIAPPSSGVKVQPPGQQ